MSDTLRVAELFAGVGGFRLGLDAAGGFETVAGGFETMAGGFETMAGGFETVWANQWEPPGTSAKQFAYRCYASHFDGCINEDIHAVMDKAEQDTSIIPDVDMVVGGFPCQDYSVAKPLSAAHGIEGKKGVLWWDIYRFLQIKEPKYCLFENVDRLLKSPATQRGRDFAIILSCLMSLGYGVEWRVVNSAAYGFPQRRKRVYIYAEKDYEPTLEYGVMSDAFPCEISDTSTVNIDDDAYKITTAWGTYKVSPFLESGIAANGTATTARVTEEFDGTCQTLGDILVEPSTVPDAYWLDPSTVERWRYLKGYKREKRVAKNGHEYWYSEGSMSFPDPTDRPSRTILTGEGGRGASRFKHVVEQNGRLRRLVPVELERLQGFPDDWTATGMTDGQRAFCMGNALVVGVVERIGRSIQNKRNQ